MVKFCCITKCKNESYPGCNASFFRIPPKEEIKQKWLDVIKSRARTISKTSTVCSRHFKHTDFNPLYCPLVRPRLKGDAVPSMFPEEIEEELRSNGGIYIESVHIDDIVVQYETPANPGTSGTTRASSDDDFTWPDTRNDSDDNQDDSENEDSNTSEQFIEHHEIEEDGTLGISEVKIEPPDEVDLNVVKEEPEPFDSILSSDGGVNSGFNPFIRVTPTNLPTINMFAILEFITKNNYYNTLDYDKLKAALQPKTKLLSSVRVQHRDFVHRVRGTVHLETSSECGIEYDTNTHTVTRCECMCAYATCEHVAALLMWIHCVSNQKAYRPNLVPEYYKPPKKIKPKTSDSKVQQTAPRAPCVTAAVHTGDEVTLTCPDDPLDVPDLSEEMPDLSEEMPDLSEMPGPSTAKRKKMEPSTPTPAYVYAPGSDPGTYTMQVHKTKSKPKDTDTKIDESIIKCSFTRKCFFNVWRSTTGNFNEKLRHTRSIMTKAFHDPNYVIDFLPLEKKLEELCMEIEGYWNSEVNKDGFESRHADWFAAVEHIDMKKTKRGVVLGASTLYGNVVL